MLKANTTMVGVEYRQADLQCKSAYRDHTEPPTAVLTFLLIIVFNVSCSIKMQALLFLAYFRINVGILGSSCICEKFFASWRSCNSMRVCVADYVFVSENMFVSLQFVCTVQTRPPGVESDVDCHHSDAFGGLPKLTPSPT